MTNNIALSDEIHSLFGLEQGSKLATPELVSKVVHPDDLDFDQPADGRHSTIESLGEMVLPTDEPRTAVSFKDKDGNEASMHWNILPDHLKEVIELSRELRQDFQLYESQSGQMRIQVDSEVDRVFRQRVRPSAPLDRDYPQK